MLLLLLLPVAELRRSSRLGLGCRADGDGASYHPKIGLVAMGGLLLLASPPLLSLLAPLRAPKRCAECGIQSLRADGSHVVVLLLLLLLLLFLP